MTHYNAAIAFNLRLISDAIDYWTAVTFPALYIAKRL